MKGSISMKGSVCLAIFLAVKRYKGNATIGQGIAAVAKLLDVSEDVLQKQLNPANETHFLTLARAEEITDLIEDPAAPMEWARRLGLATIPLPHEDGSSAPVHQRAADVAREFSDVLNAFQEAVRDNRVSPNDVLAVQRQTTELMMACSGLLNEMGRLAESRAEVIPLRGVDAA